MALNSFIRYSKRVGISVFNPIFIAVSLTFFSFAIPAQASSDFSGGAPGCWNLIRGRAVSDEEAAHFTPGCQEFRKAYLDALPLYSHDPDRLQKKLATSVREAKSFSPAYSAILLSVITSTKDLEALKARAEIETKLKVKYAYAKAALERLSAGKCSAHYASPVYSEVCDGKDDLFERLRRLR